jgi:pimeloyl-ACP methyl ester carboxylesterase
MDIGGWLFAAFLLVGFVALILFVQDRFIYFPTRYSPAQLQAAKIVGVQEIKFRTSQGNQTAFFWQNQEADKIPQNLWLVFGGNGDVALAWMELIRSFAVARTGYLLLDYPGYGVCAGRPNPQTILENSEHALQTLLAEKAWHREAEGIGVFGHSLGGAAALQFAARNKVRKIVLVSTFTTMEEMVRRQIRFPLGHLLQHRFDNLQCLKSILLQNPVPEICIFHGAIDEIIPSKMGQALAKLDPGRIQYCEIPGANHNEIIRMPLPENLRSAFFDPLAPD